MSADPYSARVRKLFDAPAHAGSIDGGAHVRVEDQGLRIQISATAADGRIRSLRFKAWGCPHVLAACEAFCADFEGRPVADLPAFSAVGLMQTLAVPVEKTGRILVLEDAARALAASLNQPSEH